MRYLPRTKQERLVATARLIAATAATIAAATTIGPQANIAISLLITAWCTFAAVMAWRVMRHWSPRTPRFVPLIDLVAAVTIILFTGGVRSPFFPLMLLAMFEASVVWSRRGLMAMILAVLGTYAAMSLSSLASAPTSTTSDPRFLLMRAGMLLLISIAMLNRTRFELRVRRDVDKLAAWPRTVGTDADRESAVRQLLSSAADVLESPRAALAWKETDGFFVALFTRQGETLEIDEDEPEEIVVSDTPSFMSRDVRAEPSPLAPSFIERLDVRSVIAVRLSSETIAGWLLLLDHRSADSDDLALAEIVARLVSSGLDQLNVVEMMRRSAAAQERVRLARDLHDGLLQSLTGLGLHAQGARQTVRTDPERAEQRLDVVIDQLAQEQSALREFVDELRPERAASRERLRTRLSRMAADLARQWSVPIDLESAPAVDALPDSVASSVVSLAAESLANAGKHAAASRIRAAVQVDDGWVSLHVQDDGRGFPFHGRFALRDLDAEDRGPASLRERVTQLGGEMTLESSPSGSRLRMRLPVC